MLDAEAIFRFVAAFAAVVGLIALLAYAAKRWRSGGWARSADGRRLEIVAATGVDAKRRAVILRADNEEHILLIGGGSDLHLGVRPARTSATEPHDAA